MKKRTVFPGAFCILFMMVICFLGVNSSRAEEKSEYRMAWILTYMEEIKDADSIRNAVEEARSANINALLPVVHRRGRAYYDSELLPVYNPTKAEMPVDTLAEFIKSAHDTSKGGQYIEVHPWVVMFPVWLEAIEPPEGHAIREHPEWLTLQYSPDPQPSSRVPQKWLDPGVPGVCDHYVKICREIVEKYDVDGLNLDYIRYYEGGHGYNPMALKRFYKQNGRSEKPAPDDPVWQKWQRRQITNLVRRIYVETKVFKPDIKLSVCSIVWGSPDKPFSESAAMQRVMQEWPAWCEEGIIDINIPMNYRSEDKPSMSRDFRTWTRFIRSATGGRIYVNGLGNYLNSVEDSIRQIKDSRDLGADGSCLFRFGVNNNENKPHTSLLNAAAEGPWEEWAPVPEMEWIDDPTSGILKGRVYIGKDKKPVDAARVRLNDHTIYTDGSGYYAFVGVRPGNTKISIEYEDESLIIEGIEIKKGQIMTKDILIDG